MKGVSVANTQKDGAGNGCGRIGLWSGLGRSASGPGPQNSAAAFPLDRPARIDGIRCVPWLFSWAAVVLTEVLGGRGCVIVL